MDFVLCNFADLFHAQSATLHTKESRKCKKAQQVLFKSISVGSSSHSQSFSQHNVTP